MRQSKFDLCGVAAKALKLQDITLYESRLERGDYTGLEGVQEEKKGTHFRKSTVEIEGDDRDSLEILVVLGIRVVPPGIEEDVEDPQFSFLIEAEYQIEYLITGDVSEDAIEAFAEFNAIHNAWPFWRQHVYDIVQKARLPKLDVPLYTG